jgi:hypothetical protein
MSAMRIKGLTPTKKIDCQAHDAPHRASYLICPLYGFAYDEGDGFI